MLFSNHNQKKKEEKTRFPQSAAAVVGEGVLPELSLLLLLLSAAGLLSPDAFLSPDSLLLAGELLFSLLPLEPLSVL
jgi:hypothetical protein